MEKICKIPNEKKKNVVPSKQFAITEDVNQNLECVDGLGIL